MIFGTCIVVSYPFSLRGSKRLLLDLVHLFKHFNIIRNYAIACLRGKMKAEDCVKDHTLPMNLKYDSGVEIGKCLSALFDVH